MPLPPSFAKYETALQIQKVRSTMIGLDGPPDSGKTEFCMSAPGPGILLALDRGLKGALDNPEPPKSRNPNFAFRTIPIPLATQLGTKEQYLEHWKLFYAEYLTALGNVDCRTFVLDGDSDSWELQRLAEFGRLSKVPSNLYDNVNAARRGMYARANDAKKIFLATNRIRKTYVTKMTPAGVPELNGSGNEVRVWNGEFERQGFSDQDYLWQTQLRCFRTPNGDFGVKVLKCKPNKEIVGMPFTGGDCNFASLIEAIYPHIPVKEWGF